jgi:DNA-binding NarL/FixJ family response regulator
MVPDVSIQIFLLIENRLLRESLARLFRKRADLSVIGQASLTDTALGSANDVPCDILLMDRFLEAPSITLSLPRNGQPDSDRKQIVLIGMDENEGQFLAAVRAGVAGYLLKDASAGDVVSAVRAVAHGEAICPPRLCRSLFRTVARHARENPVPTAVPNPGLTLRQRQLVSLVARGLTNKEIASHLNLSEFTVKNHLHRIMKQVDAGTRHEAVETILAFSAAASH